MDEEGYFYIVDRKKDMIICSGYKEEICRGNSLAHTLEIASGGIYVQDSDH